MAFEAEHRNLLWAVREVGQCFGIATELVLQTQDLTLMGPNGVPQLRSTPFSTERASEVCSVLRDVVSASDHASAGRFVAVHDPSKGRILMVAAQYFGTGPELQAIYQPVIELIWPR